MGFTGAARCPTRSPTTARMPSIGCQEIYAEHLEVILKSFSTKTLNWKGQYNHFENVPMEMEPLQKPHPPLWYGAHSPDSAERAARRGLHMVCNDPPALARAIHERFRQVWREVNGENAVLPKMGMVRMIVVADSDGEAMAIARRAYLRWRTSFCYLHEMHGTPPNSPLNVASFDKLIEQGQAIAGSPETVRAFLADQIADTGANYVVGQLCFGDLTLDEMLRSVELFAAHVMPRRCGRRSARTRSWRPRALLFHGKMPRSFPADAQPRICAKAGSPRPSGVWRSDLLQNRSAPQAFLQLLMNFLRGLPCRLLASASFEHSNDFAVRGACAFLAMDAAGLAVGAVCAMAIPPLNKATVPRAAINILIVMVQSS